MRAKKTGGLGGRKIAIFVSTDVKMLVATRVIKVLRGEEASSYLFFLLGWQFCLSNFC